MGFNDCIQTTMLKIIYFIGIVMLLSVEGTVDRQPGCDTSSDEIDGYGGLISSNDKDNYPSQVTCTQTINADSHYDKILLQFTHIDLNSYDCSTEYINVTDGNGNLLATVCDTEDHSSITATGRLTLSLTVGYHNTYFQGYEAVYTLYYSDSDDCDEFKCDSNRCIDKDLLCDDKYNCEDDSDEEDCKSGGGFQFGGIIGGIIGGCVGMFFLGRAVYRHYIYRSSSQTRGTPGTNQTGGVPTGTVPPPPPQANEPGVGFNKTGYSDPSAYNTAYNAPPPSGQQSGYFTYGGAEPTPPPPTYDSAVKQ